MRIAGFDVVTTAKGEYAVYERLTDGRRWNCRAVVVTEAEAQEWAVRFTRTQREIDAWLAKQPPVDPNLPTCWECGCVIEPGHGVLDSGLWAHRSCVGA